MSKTRPVFKPKNIHHQDPLYSRWCQMMARCFNKNRQDYKYYGARGITVCERWKIFINFYNDLKVSYKPGLTLDRIDNNGNYEPSNCRWISHQKQCNNRRSCVYLTNPETKETKTATEWSRIYNMSFRTIYSRMRRGYTDFFALVSPTHGIRNGRIKNDRA